MPSSRLPPSLKPGGISGITEVVLHCSKRHAREVRAFWTELGLVPEDGFVNGTADPSGAGTRLSFALGDGTVLSYRVRPMPPALAEAMTWARQHVFGHVRLRVDADSLASLLSHPALNADLGEGGLVRHGPAHASVSLRAPLGLHVEFHCLNAPADLAAP